MQQNDEHWRWVKGDTIWYDPGGLGILFKGVVVKESHRLAGENFVGIGELPPEYRPYANNPNALVTTALQKNVWFRSRNDDRTSIHWNEYLKSLPSKLMGHAEGQKDPGS